MAKFVLAGEDFDWYFSDWEKTIHLCGCYYSVTIHLQDQFVNTPKTKALGIAKKAIQKVADAVTLWDKMEKEWSQHQ